MEGTSRVKIKLPIYYFKIISLSKGIHRENATHYQFGISGET